MKTLISIFDYSGTCAEPFEDAGWQCLNIDKQLIDLDDMFNSINPVHYTDIMDMTTKWFYENIFENDIEVNGIIAFPPCTRFTRSGAAHWGKADQSGETDYYVMLVYRTLAIIDLCKPDNFWYIENPIGRIAKLVPELQDYRKGYYQPYQYGDPYSKKTALYGEFVMPDPVNQVAPVCSGTKESSLDYYFRTVAKAPDFMKRRSYYRSITPQGFSNAFYEANKDLVSSSFYDADNDDYIDLFN